MRLSTVFELLLIFLIIAFAAYGRVIERDGAKPRHISRSSRHNKNIGVSLMTLKDAANNVNKYCQCDAKQCDCCREFPISGLNVLGNEGCVSLKYLENDNLAVQLKYGSNILTTKIIRGKKQESICMKMPGGFSEFCGKIYSIKREEDHFKACLGLELRSSNDVEASLRVSCFRFGQEGIKLLPAEEFPIDENPTKLEEDDEDDDYFNFDDDDDEESDDTENDAPVKDTASPKPDNDDDDDDDEDEDEDDDDDDIDLGDLGEIIDFLTGGDGEKKKPSTTVAPFIIPSVTKPIVASTPASTPLVNKKPSKLPIASTTSTPIISTTRQPQKVTEKIPEISTIQQEIEISTEQPLEMSTQKTVDIIETTEESSTIEFNPTDLSIESTTLLETNADEKPVEQSANNIDIVTAKPEIPAMIVKKIILGTNKKVSTGSSHINAIKNDKQKPLSRPIKTDSKPIKQTETNDDEEIDLGELTGLGSLEDDDEETESTEEHDSVEEENEEDKDEEIEVEENEKPENDDDETDILESLSDDSEEEDEEEVINALVGNNNEKEKEKTKIKEKEKPIINEKNSDKDADNMASKPEEDDAEYGLSLAEFMARGRHLKSGRGRQSKVMRL